MVNRDAALHAALKWRQQASDMEPFRECDCRYAFPRPSERPNSRKAARTAETWCASLL